MDLSAALVWAAAQPALDPARIQAAIDAGADTPRVAGIAIRQRIGPLLHRALTEAGRLGAAGDAEERLRAEADLRRLQSLVLLPEAARLAIGPLRAAGMTPLVFKGPSISLRYPSPALRPMDDVDLLVPPEQHGAALTAL